MKKIHVLAVAALLGLAAVVGVVAASQTAGIGTAQTARASNHTIVLRAKRLDAAERALKRALAHRPPALPARPSASSSSAAPVAQVIYRRPAPVVVLKHRGANGEQEHEQESEGSND